MSASWGATRWREGGSVISGNASSTAMARVTTGGSGSDAVGTPYYDAFDASLSEWVSAAVALSVPT